MIGTKNEDGNLHNHSTRFQDHIMTSEYVTHCSQNNCEFGTVFLFYFAIVINKGLRWMNVNTSATSSVGLSPVSGITVY